MSLLNNGLRRHDVDSDVDAAAGITQLTGDVTAGPGSGSQAATITRTALLSPVRQQSGATYTFAASDVGEYIQFTNAAPTVTINTDAIVPMPANAEINFEATGGTVTVAAAGGVTLNSPGGKVASSAQYVALTLKRTATDVWTLIGSLA